MSKDCESIGLRAKLLSIEARIFSLQCHYLCMKAHDDYAIHHVDGSGCYTEEAYLDVALELDKLSREAADVSLRKVQAECGSGNPSPEASDSVEGNQETRNLPQDGPINHPDPEGNPAGTTAVCYMCKGTRLVDGRNCRKCVKAWSMGLACSRCAGEGCEACNPVEAK